MEKEKEDPETVMDMTETAVDATEKTGTQASDSRWYTQPRTYVVNKI